MFRFRLALRLGMSVEKLERTVSARELAEWEAFDSIDPIGDERGDLLMGILASLMANMNRKKGSKAYRPSDFMPFVDREAVKKADTAALGEQIKAALAGGGKRN